MKRYRYIALIIAVVILVPVMLRGGDIHDAIKKGSLETVKTLLKQDKSLLERVDKDGWTPLMNALLKGQSEIAGFLIKKGADVHVKSQNGWTTISLAARYKL
ncbi:MAG: ankyrin repeat domain-containing protein, partial [bacterium]|nr:ankyrin repeat domain-containing protein [bacterium]